MQLRIVAARRANEGGLAPSRRLGDSQVVHYADQIYWVGPAEGSLRAEIPPSLFKLLELVLLQRVEASVIPGQVADPTIHIDEIRKHINMLNASRCVQRWVVCLWSCAIVAVQASEPPNENNAPLYLIHESSGWGLIDAAGKIVLEPRFEQVAGRPSRTGLQGPALKELVLDQIGRAEPVSDRLIPIRLGGKAGFASRDGKLLELGSYDSIAPRASGDRFSVSKNGRFGYVDTAGEIVIPLEYEAARPFQGGYAFVMRAGKWGVVDPNGKTVVEPLWEEVAEVYEATANYEWRAVRNGTRWGVVDRSGREILPLRYDEIPNPTPPLVAAVTQGRPIYVRPGGEIAFDVPCPAARQGKDPDAKGFPFFDHPIAMISCGKHRKLGLVDVSGRVVLAPEWDNISQFDHGHAVVTRGSKKALVDVHGSIRLSLGKYDLYGPYDGVVAFAEKSQGPFGFMDLQGRVVVPPTLDWFRGCEEGLCLVCRQSKSGFVDVNGDWLIEPQLQFAEPFHGPLALTTRGVGSTAELGYIDRKGATVYTMRIDGVRIGGQCGLMQVSVE